MALSDYTHLTRGGSGVPSATLDTNAYHGVHGQHGAVRTNGVPSTPEKAHMHTLNAHPSSGKAERRLKGARRLSQVRPRPSSRSGSCSP